MIIIIPDLMLESNFTGVISVSKFYQRKEWILTLSIADGQPRSEVRLSLC